MPFQRAGLGGHCSTKARTGNFAGMLRFLTLPAVAIGWFVAASGIVGAQDDRPYLVLRPGGAVTTVTALAFSPDSSRLYVAGHDKFVQVWELRELGRAARRHDAVPAGSLRWEIARGVRGTIFCLAPSRMEPLLAVGGNAASRTAWGNIVLFNTDTAEVSKVLASDRDGHGQSLASLSFAPNGRRLASLSVDGHLRIWSVDDGASRRLKTPATETFPRQHALFLNDRWLVSSFWSPSTRAWHVARYDTAQAQPRAEVLTQQHVGGVTALAVDPAGNRWSSADGDGRVFVWDGPLARQPRLVRKDRIATSLAFGPAGTLFVATQANPARRHSSLLEMWNTLPAVPIQRDTLATSAHENNSACAVSPDLRWVATCTGDQHDVSIFPLVDAQGQPLPKPLGGRPIVLRGAGNKMEVAFAEDGSYRLGFGPLRSQTGLPDDHGTITQAFDLRKHGLQPATPDGWRQPTDRRRSVGSES